MRTRTPSWPYAIEGTPLVPDLSAIETNGWVSLRLTRPLDCTERTIERLYACVNASRRLPPRAPPRLALLGLAELADQLLRRHLMGQALQGHSRYRARSHIDVLSKLLGPHRPQVLIDCGG